MNLMYEELPTSISVKDKRIRIVTDFREYVRLIDILEDISLSPYEKKYLINQYFIDVPGNFESAIDALADFITMEELSISPDTEPDGEDKGRKKRNEVYSFKVDYPYIMSAFLRDYGINIRTVKYMHWWEFRMLFDGLSEDTEIKQRIMYRGTDLNKIKDKDERKRIEQIQRSIQLPNANLTDYDIGDAFAW